MSAWVPILIFSFGMTLAPLLERALPLRDRSNDPKGHLKANFQLLPFVMAAGWIVGFVIAYWSIFCAEHGIGLLHLIGLKGPLATVLGFILFELGDYGRHYAFHKLPFFWRLHRVHHSDPALDFSSAFRTHPGENFAQGAVYVCVIACFGVPLQSLLWRTPVLFAALIFQHCNLALPPWLDRAVCLVTPSPRQHRVHHSPDPTRSDLNFAVILTVWDRVLGTYVYPSQGDPLATGLDRQPP